VTREPAKLTWTCSGKTSHFFSHPTAFKIPATLRLQSSSPECAYCSIARNLVGKVGRRDFYVHAGKRRKKSLESVSPTTLWSENFPNMEKTASMRLWKRRVGQLEHSCCHTLLGSACHPNGRPKVLSSDKLLDVSAKKQSPGKRESIQLGSGGGKNCRIL
jgi:hypothetical protein